MPYLDLFIVRQPPVVMQAIKDAIKLNGKDCQKLALKILTNIWSVILKYFLPAPLK